MPSAPRERLYAWLAFVLCTLWFSLGCSPATLSFFFLPFMDDKIPARCKLSGKKEVTVALLCNFAAPPARPELLGADQDLAERLTLALTKSFKDNKEKVKLVPLAQVRSYQNQQGSTASDYDIGKHFKADFVITLEINSLDLYEYKGPQLFRGRTEISVRVLDLNKPRGEGPIFDPIYANEYPRQSPIDAGNSSPLQFRSLFLTRVARDLSRWFSAYPADQKWDMD